jgi:hypothetical protein
MVVVRNELLKQIWVSVYGNQAGELAASAPKTVWQEWTRGMIG